MISGYDELIKLSQLWGITMYEFIKEVYNSASKLEQLKEVAGFSDFARARATQEMFRNFLRTTNLPCEVLEIGPGSGFITEYLNQELPAKGGGALDIMDFSDGFIESTKTKHYNIRDFIHLDVSLYQESFSIIEKYDLVLFQEVLEHLVSPFTALYNINSMLKPGGYLYLTVPNSGHWRRLLNEVLRPKVFLRHNNYLDTHISEISTTGLVKLVSMAGFNIENVDYYTSHYPLLKPLFSTQIGFLLTKTSDPEQRWRDLTSRITNYWDKKLTTSRA